MDLFDRMLISTKTSMEVKMDSLHSIMDKRKKWTHLSLEERVIIQTRLKDHCSLRSIAREIGCSPSTIHYEIKRGAYHGKVKRYKAQRGQSVYQNNRRYCERNRIFLRSISLLITSNSTSLKMAGRSTPAVIAALL